MNPILPSALPLSLKFQIDSTLLIIETAKYNQHRSKKKNSI